MLLKILIIFCLFNSYHHINAFSVSQDKTEFGKGFKEMITNTKKKMDDLKTTCPPGSPPGSFFYSGSCYFYLSYPDISVDKAASYCHSRNVTIGNIEIHAKLWDIETDVEFYYILTHRYNQTESSKADPKIAVDFTEGKKLLNLSKSSGEQQIRSVGNTSDYSLIYKPDINIPLENTSLIILIQKKKEQIILEEENRSHEKSNRFICKMKIDSCSNNTSCDPYGKCKSLAATFECQCSFLHTGNGKHCNDLSNRDIQSIVGIILVGLAILSFICHSCNQKSRTKKNNLMSTINSHRQPQEEFSLNPNIPSDQLINSAFTNDIETSAILLNAPHTAIQLRRSLLASSSSSTTIFFRHSCCYYLWRFVIGLITILFATLCCHTIYQFKIEHLHATNQTVYAIIHNNTQENTSDICKLFVSKLNLYYKIPASYISLMILFILILSQLFFRNRSCLKTSTCKTFWKHLSIPMIFNAHSHIYRFQSAAVFGILALEILHIFDEYIIHGAKHFYHGPLVDLAIQFGMGLLSGLRYCPILSIFEQENNYENRLENLISYGLGAIFLYCEIIFKFQSDTNCPLDNKKMSIINQTLEKLHEMSVDAKVYLTENLGVEGTTKLNETYQKIPSWFKGKFESFTPDNINEVTNELTRLKDSLELNEQSIKYNILRNAPYYYFIVYVAVCLTILFLKTFHRKCQKSSSLQSLPRWKYVKYNLLKTTKYIYSNEQNNYSCLFHCLNSLIVFFKQHIYSIRPYFRYSKLIICIYTSALTLVYYFTYWILDHAYILTKKLLLFLNLIVCGLSKSSNDLCFNLNMNSTDYENHINRNTRYICLITAFIICLQLFFALKHYQNQMCHAYRGVLLDMPQLKHLSSSSIISKSIHYPGRFMGSLVYSYGFLFFFVSIFYVLCRYILYPIFTLGFASKLILLILPMIILFLFQFLFLRLLCKLLFMKNNHVLALRNLRLYYAFSYFSFFIDCFLGFIMCISRITTGLMCTVFLFARLDYSAYGRTLEMYDTSYAAYVSYFYIEKNQRHPVLNVFIDIIRQRLIDKRRLKLRLKMNDNINEIYENEPRSHFARFRWALAYTLIHNEQLKRYRKYRLRSTQTVQSRTLKRLFDKISLL